MNRHCLFLLLLPLVIGCQQESSQPKKSGWDGYRKVDSTIKQANGSLWGTGRLIVKRHLESLQTKGHFLIKGQFLNEDSHFKLHSHFNGFDVRDGIEVKFIRNKKALEITASSPDFPQKLIFSDSEYFSSATHFRFRIEIHNQTTDGFNVWVWKDYVSFSGGQAHPLPQITRNNALASTENMFFRTSGRGLNWGLELKRVSLSTARRNTAYLRNNE